MHVLRKLGAIAALAVFGTLPAHAAVWNEVNAGDLPGTAEIPLTGQVPLTQINGHLDYDLSTNLWQIDMYRVLIVDPATFSAHTVGGPSDVADPMLWLFDLAGHGVYMNDDNSGADHQSTLPAGNAAGPAAPGFYYLAVGWFAADPEDAGPNSIFPYPFSAFDPTGVYGANGGTGPVAGWASFGPNNFDLPSDYRIVLTGASAPEPGTLALLAVAAAGAFVRRRRIH